jgi:hypothetical protein
MPTSTASGSFVLAVPGTDVGLKMLHGQLAAGTAVVKVQEYGAAMVWPLVLAAPLTVAV